MMSYLFRDRYVQLVLRNECTQANDNVLRTLRHPETAVTESQIRLLQRPNSPIPQKPRETQRSISEMASFRT